MYVAGQRALSGAPIYLMTDGWLPFKYHPAWAVVFSALSLLPEKAAFVLFNTTMLGCWAWAASIWARWLNYDLRKPINFWILLLISFSALYSEMSYGQINGILFIGATKVFDWLGARPQRWFAAGLTVAVLCSLKLNFAFLAVFCVIRNFRSLLGILVGALAVHAATAAFFGDWIGIDLYRTWINVLLDQSAEQYAHVDSQGLLRVLLQATPEFGRWLWLVSIAMAVVGGIALERYRPSNDPLIASYWLSATYLLSPLAWWYQIPFMLPLAFLLLKQDIGRVERGILYLSLAIYAIALPTREVIATFKNANVVFFASAAIVMVMLINLWNTRQASTRGAYGGANVRSGSKAEELAAP